MALSFVTLFSAAVAALAGQADAAKYYKQTDVYNSGNFLNKFDFISDTDPNGGFVQYQTKANAQKLGLVKTENSQVYIGADYTNTYSTTSKGRKSVRMESKKTYNHGLFIADFTHLPKPVCGAWPAYWFFGAPWPTKGEIDIYENWNDLEFNRHTAHVDSPDIVGECTISSTGMTSVVDSPNCYDFAAGQYNYQGCSASDYSTTFGNENGGIFAFQWTSEFLKIWDWPQGSAPSDVTSGSPAPSSSWGTPSFVISSCDIPSAFQDMKMTFNIDFCAVAGQSDKWDPSCKAKTKKDTCVEHVALHPAAFTAAYFKVKTIKVYQLADASTKRELLLDEEEDVLVEEENFARSVMPLSTTSCTDDIPAPIDTPTAVLPIISRTTYPAAPQVTNDYPEEEEMTTSTIYSTRTQTITSCPPSVQNCPVGSVTTNTVVVGTTVCPVSAKTTKTTKPVKPTTYAEVPETYPTRTTNAHRPSKETTHHHDEEQTYPKETQHHHHKQPRPTTETAKKPETETYPVQEMPSSSTTQGQETTYPTSVATTTTTTKTEQEEKVESYPTTTNPVVVGGGESSSSTKTAVTTLTSTFYQTTTVTLAYAHSSYSSTSTSTYTIPTTPTQQQPEKVPEEEEEEEVYVTQTVVPIPPAPTTTSTTTLPSSSSTLKSYYPTGVPLPPVGNGNGTSPGPSPTYAASTGCVEGDMTEGECDEEDSSSSPSPSGSTSTYPVASSPPVSGGAGEGRSGSLGGLVVAMLGVLMMM